MYCYYSMSSLYSVGSRLRGAGIVGAALAGGLTALKYGYLASRAARVDPKFATNWSERRSTAVSVPRSTMLGVKRRWSRKPRYGLRKRRGTIPGKALGSGLYKRLVRTGNPFTLQLAGATQVAGALNMNLACKTSDLTSLFRLYRIRKVVLHLVPRVDTANSGVTNNFQAMINCCCDPEDDTSPASVADVTAYDNSYSKFVVSGDRFRYTFYPKVRNTVSNGGITTVNSGSYGMNPWLTLDTAGTSVPHYCLKYVINAVGNTSPTTVNFNCFYEYHFDVKGVA